jgi:hypothetical protein
LLIGYKGFGDANLVSFDIVDSISKKCIKKQKKSDMAQGWRTYPSKLLTTYKCSNARQ